MTFILSKPPAINDQNPVRIFLAGSIENGKAKDWQTTLAEYLKDSSNSMQRPLMVFNPRRDDWDSTWVQSIENEKFKEQVWWEQEMLSQSDIIVFWFEPGTMSPITLLEFGQVCCSSVEKTVLVYCPEEFWRSGNVHVLCEMYGIELFTDDREFQMAVCYAALIHGGLK